MQKSRKKILAWTAAAAIVAGGGMVAVQQVRGASAAAEPYRTQSVERTRVTATVTATGTLSPLKTVQVGSQVSGRVLELDADFNSVVKKGDVLARIDPRLFDSEVARSRANLASAKASVVKAEASLADARKQDERAQAQLARGILAQADADTAAANAKSAAAQRAVAQADVAQAAATLQQAQTNLAMTTIYSPIDGTVISRDVDVGQTVAASLQAPTLFTIAQDMRAMEIHTSVAEADIGPLQDGMAVSFTVDAFPGERFRGTVTQIRNAPTTVQNVVTYDAVVRVENDELKLRPGMTANVRFVVADKRDVLAVPSAALRFTPPGAAADRGSRRNPSARMVWVLDGGKPRPVEVQVGASDGRMQEIVAGELPEGAKVIVGAAGDAPAAASQQRPPFGGGGGGRGRGLGGL